MTWQLAGITSVPSRTANDACLPAASVLSLVGEHVLLLGPVRARRPGRRGVGCLPCYVHHTLTAMSVSLNRPYVNKIPYQQTMYRQCNFTSITASYIPRLAGEWSCYH